MVSGKQSGMSIISAQSVTDRSSGTDSVARMYLRGYGYDNAPSPLTDKQERYKRITGTEIRIPSLPASEKD